MRLRDEFRKADWLGELQVVLVLGVIVTGVALVVGAWGVVSDAPVTAVVPARAVTAVAGGGLPAGVDVPADSDVEVRIEDPGTRQVVAYVLTRASSVVVALVVLVMLLRVVTAARRGDPFTRLIVVRLRLLAVVALLGGGIASVIEALARLDLSSSVADSAATSWDFPGGWVLMGAGILAVGEIIRRGTAMRAELDTVI